MGAGETSMIALVGALALWGLGWAAVHTIRGGFDYISSRGNPRNRAQAHETMRDIGIGVALIAISAGATGAYLYGLIKF